MGLNWAKLSLSLGYTFGLLAELSWTKKYCLSQ